MKKLLILTSILLLGCKQYVEQYEKHHTGSDTVIQVDPDSVVYVNYLNAEEDVVEEKPIPLHTKYKVSDIVCVWEKWTGIVSGIEWSDADPNLLIYRVSFPQLSEEEEPGDSWYYDTELELGKCR